MAQKTFQLDGVGTVVIAKRRGSSSLRLSVRADGSVRVGLPTWLPYATGLDFARQKRAWIKRHQVDRAPIVLADGQQIGKSFRLEIIQSLSATKPRTKVAANIVSVTAGTDYRHQSVQTAAMRACEKALKLEAQQLLGSRVADIATNQGFNYNGVKIKKLRSRWGSCSSDRVITLNYYLIQLPWRLIDYVIVHELAHTHHLNHSREFWQLVEALLPDSKQLKREIKAYKPLLIPRSIAD